jgi:peptidoglycan-associated lipoprotein
MSFSPTGSDSGTIDGLVTIHFDYDKATLSGESKKQLQSNAKWIKEHKNVSMQIEGHCDDRGSIEYNLALGERRAKAVRSYLTSLGIDGKRLNIISYGKERPVAQGDSEDAMGKNRRANFVPQGG